MNQDKPERFLAFLAITVGIGFIIYKEFYSMKKTANTLPMLILQLNCPYCKKGLKEYAYIDFPASGISQKVFKCEHCTEGEKNDIYYRADGCAFKSDHITIYRLQ